MDKTALKELQRILGEENVRFGAASLARYLSEPLQDPRIILATPRNTDRLSDVAVFCHENDIPLFSVKRRYIEGSLARREGVLVDLSGMDTIKKIDRRNLIAHIYAGVTFEQLQRELEGENLRLLFPVAAQSPSVLRSYIDRDMLMGSGVYRHPHLSIFHAVLSNGQFWVSGSQQLTDEGHADFREDQGPQFSTFFGASEDIFGIPYYGLVYLYPNREERRLLAFGFDEVGPASEFIYGVARREHCFEAFAANDRYLGVVLGDGDRGRVSEIRKKLKPWTAVVTLEHYRELVDLWEGYVRDAAKELGGRQLRGQVPGMLEGSLKKAWYVHDRDFFKGRCQHVFCYQYFKNVPETFEIVDEQASKAGVKPEELGKILLPTYFGGAAYCEADIYYNPRDEKAAESADRTYTGAFEALLDNRAFVDKPVGKVARMVFSRTDPSYVEMIKRFKRTVDPKGILNPGQLLEGV